MYIYIYIVIYILSFFQIVAFFHSPDCCLLSVTNGL